jgi:hypothetical protein
MEEEYTKVCEQLESFSKADLPPDAKLELRLALPSRMRRRLYEKIDTYYCGTLLHNQSKHHDGGAGYTIMTVMKFGEGIEELLSSLHVRNDDLLVSHFDKYLKPGLPVVKELEEGDLDYYLDTLEPYRGARTKFEGYRGDLEKLGTVGKVDGYIERTMTSIREWILAQAEFVEFQNTDIPTDLKSPYKAIANLYNAGNASKKFISVDVNKANFTIIRKFYPNLFKGLERWEDFVKTFDPKELYTIRESKFLREKLFGDLRACRLTTRLAENLMKQTLQDEGIPPSEIILLSGDEFVVPYTPELYTQLYDKYHNATFKVLAFTLVKLPVYGYFVKEYFTTDGGEVVGREFKCVPAQFLLECIKKYEGRPVALLDRQFTSDNGRVAIFKNELFRD